VTDASSIKDWHRKRLLIDLDAQYPQGIVTVTKVGNLTRVAWKCDDATYKIGTDRAFWSGHDSFGSEIAAQAVIGKMVDLMEHYGLAPELIL
jgi:hypothetical protein